MTYLPTRILAQIAALAVVSLVGSAAFAQTTDQPLAGTKIVVKRASSGKETLNVVLKDPALLFPLFDELGDPTISGLTIELFGAGGERATLAVPAGIGKPGWKRVGGNLNRYVFKNPEAPGGVSEVATIVIRQGRGLQLKAKRTGLTLAGPQGSVGVRVTTGELRNCALFGAATISTDEGGRFIAKDAPASALTSCATGSLGGVVQCGDGVVDAPSEECDGPGSCSTVFGNIDCMPPGVPGECTCCGGQCGDVAGCCGPGIRPVPAPGPCNESCISTSCESPWTCSPGYDCVGGGCCGTAGAFCVNTLFNITMPCCAGKVCGRFVGQFFGACCVPNGGACATNTDCCSNVCGVGGTCDPP